MIVAYFPCCILFLMFMKFSLRIEVFWLNMVKFELICNMCTIQSYLATWGLRLILAMVLSKFMRKSRREEREMMWQGEGRERAISAMVLPKLLRLKISSLDCQAAQQFTEKRREKILYYGNPIAKIGESRKKIACNVVLPKLVSLGERKQIRTISIQVLK